MVQDACSCQVFAVQVGGVWWSCGGGVWGLGGCKILVPPQYGQKHVSGRSSISHEQCDSVCSTLENV
jgi:hypothetical protein